MKNTDFTVYFPVTSHGVARCGGYTTEDLQEVYRRVEKFLHQLEEEIDTRHEIQIGMSVFYMEQEICTMSEEAATTEQGE